MYHTFFTILSKWHRVVKQKQDQKPNRSQLAVWPHSDHSKRRVILSKCVFTVRPSGHSAHLQRRHLKGHDGKSKRNFSLVWLEGERQHLSWCVYLLLLCLTVCFGASGVVKLCRCHTLACVMPHIFTVLFSKKEMYK